MAFILWVLMGTGLLTPLFRSSQGFLLDSCPAFSESLCRVGSLRGQADLLEVQFSGVKVRCDQQLTKAQTSSTPLLSYSKAVAGKEYLFVMSDPDAPYPCAKVLDPNGSFLHHLATMVSGEDGALTVKTSVVPYHGPSPPRSVHRYQLRLYALPPRPLPQDLGHTSRFNFKLDHLVSRLGLPSPVAVFQVKVAHQA